MATEPRRWLPIPFRLGVVLVVGPAAVEKFLDYPGQVAFFEGLGVPAASVLVPIVGLAELTAVVAIGLGLYGRIAAVPLSIMMISAILFGGPNAANVSALLSAFVVAARGTGPYSIREVSLAVTVRSLAATVRSVRSRLR